MVKRLFQIVRVVGFTALIALLAVRGGRIGIPTAAAQHYDPSYGLCYQTGSTVYDLNAHQLRQLADYSLHGQIQDFNPTYSESANQGVVSGDGRYTARFSNTVSSANDVPVTLTIERIDGVVVVTLYNVTPLNDQIRWSPDSRRIAFLTRIPRMMNAPDTMLTIVGIDGSVTHLATPHMNNSAFVDWSPDGRWLMYSELGAANENFTIISPDGRQIRSFNPQLPVAYPRYTYNWSPDGSVIVFSVPGQGYGIRYVSLAADQTFGQVSDVNSGALYYADGDLDSTVWWLAWAPDGHSFGYFMLALTTDVHIKSNVLLIVDPKSNRVAVYKAPSQMSFPTDLHRKWSPDSRNVALRVTADEDKNPTLYIYGKDTPSDGMRIGALPNFSPGGGGGGGGGGGAPGSSGSGSKTSDTDMGFASFSQAWSADGRGLYYVPANSQTLAEYHLDTQQTDLAITTPLYSAFFATDDQKFIVFDEAAQPDTYQILDTRNNQITRLNDLVGGAESAKPLFITIDPWLHGDQLNAVIKNGNVIHVELLDLATHQRQMLHDNLTTYFGTDRLFPADPNHEYHPSPVQMWWRAADGSSGFDAYDNSGRILFQVKMNLQAQLDERDIRTVWSPNHKQIAFVVDNDELQFAWPDGSALRVIATIPPLSTTLAKQYQAQYLEPIYSIDWSPDSSLLAYATATDDNGALNFSITIITADGSPVTQFKADLPGPRSTEGFGWVQCQLSAPSAS